MRPDAMRPRSRPKPERVRPRLRPSDLASRPMGLEALTSLEISIDSCGRRAAGASVQQVADKIGGWMQKC